MVKYVLKNITQENLNLGLFNENGVAVYLEPGKSYETTDPKVFDEIMKAVNGLVEVNVIETKENTTPSETTTSDKTQDTKSKSKKK